MTSTLPPSDRVFVVQMALGGADHVIGADAERLWAAHVTADGEARVLWNVSGKGTVHRVAAGDIGRGPRLYAARGTSRSDRGAPLSLLELDPGTGESREIWQHQGARNQHTNARNEAAYLGLDDVDGDGTADLALAYFTDTHHVRTRHMTMAGQLIEGPPIRMATSRAYADVDGDGEIDEIVGRLYGDSATEPGELRVYPSGRDPIAVPTDKGVRALVVAPDAEGKPSIYFSDGWVARYAHEAKAQLKRARWVDGRFEVEKLGDSPDEYTFFDLVAVERAGGSAPLIVAQGSRRLTVFEPRAELPWAARAVAPIGEVTNIAVGRDAQGRLTAYVPGRPATRVIPIPPTAP